MPVSSKSAAETLMALQNDERQTIQDLIELLDLVLTSLEMVSACLSIAPSSITSSARKRLSTIQLRGSLPERFIEYQKQVDSLLSQYRESDSPDMTIPVTIGALPRTD